jgi:hypothetical protein
MNTVIRASALYLLALTALFATGQAQQKPMALDELTMEAEVIAVGRVTALASEWDDGKTRIITRVILAVDEYLKETHERSRVLTVVTLGGAVGEDGEFYTQVATFRQNEHVVVFLEKDNRGNYRVSSGTQGKYSIERNPESGHLTVAGGLPVQEFSSAVKRSLNRPKPPPPRKVAVSC